MWKIPPLDTASFPKKQAKTKRKQNADSQLVPAFSPFVHLWQPQTNADLRKSHHQKGRMGRGKSLIFCSCKLGGISSTIFSTKRAHVILREAGCLSSTESNKDWLLHFQIHRPLIWYHIHPIFSVSNKNFFHRRSNIKIFLNNLGYSNTAITPILSKFFF